MRVGAYLASTEDLARAPRLDGRQRVLGWQVVREGHGGGCDGRGGRDGRQLGEGVHRTGRRRARRGGLGNGSDGEDGGMQGKQDA